MKSTKKKVFLCLCISVVIFVGIGIVQYARGEWFSSTSDSTKISEQKNISDLAELSGLSEDTVSKLYNSVDSWPTLRDNIFVYKRIISLVPEDLITSDKIFEIIEKYEPDKILTVCEFLVDNGNDFKKLESILTAQAEGKELEAVFADNLATKEYKVYKPASEEEIKNWFAKGYLAEDILSADKIAMEKDLELEKVLGLKTDENTWDQIAAEYGVALTDSSEKQVNLRVQESGNDIEVYSAKDYAVLVDQAKGKAERAKAKKKGDISKELGVSSEKIKQYEEQGFNTYEVRNAYKLAESSGADVKEIFAYKQNGATWEATIKHFSGEGKKAKP